MPRPRHICAKSKYMEVQRKCRWCGKPFIAHTMVTRYCSKSCNEKAYKEKKRKQRLQAYEERQNEQPMQEVGIVGSKLYLSLPKPLPF